jgi:hypothetical protein
MSYDNGQTQPNVSYKDKTVDAVTSLYNGDIELDWEGGYERDPTLIIKQTKPLPSSILAIIPSYDVTGQ